MMEVGVSDLEEDCSDSPREMTMDRNNKTWLQLYVDATTERDPYKRLALVRQLRKMPRQEESDDFLEVVLEERPSYQTRKEARKTKTARRR